MTKQEMAECLSAGCRLIQEEWADGTEIDAVDELVTEGKARATPWHWVNGYEAMRRVVTGVRP